uniref:non-specific serine/threonine protein kinase n=1 Tax=Saccoglossus kowalevskii TaxID=10224 RepID=A0ABM0GSH5_SACKO|nr:PREDICTED: leucine-rich repeat serine/threonine-protein kinase 1-like [Saccoglossus kowalevskii]
MASPTSTVQALIEKILSAVKHGDCETIADIFYNDPQCVKLLEEVLPLRNKNQRGHEFLCDLLHIVCEYGNVDILMLFLAMDVDVDFTTHKGTPLCVACEYGHFDIVKRLVEHGADYYRASPELGTPLYIATQKNYINVVDFLIVNNPDLIRLQETKDTMLHAACLGGSHEMIEYWINYGANINGQVYVYKDWRGDEPQTPLEAACSSGSVDVIHFLIKNGAEITTDVISNHGEFLCNVFLDSKYIRNRYDSCTEVKVDGTKTVTQNHVAKWSNLKLHGVSAHWFVNIAETLVEIQLSNNSGVKQLPSVFPWRLPALECVYISRSGLEYLPDPKDEVICQRLKELNVSHNLLHSVPIALFQLPSLERLNLSNNILTSLGEGNSLHDSTVSSDSALSDSFSEENTDTWNCSGLVHLDVSYNALYKLPRYLRAANKLESLNVSNNKLKTFPRLWSCPLETLDASNNKITTIPNDINVYWSNSLRILDLSNNKLQEIRWGVCQLVRLRDLLLAYNRIDRLPDPTYWNENTDLRKLVLSFNKLANGPDPACIELTSGSPGCSLSSSSSSSSPSNKKRFSFPRIRLGSKSSTTWHSEDYEGETSIEFPSQFFTSLDSLSLDNNRLRSVPKMVCKMESLRMLNLSNNAGITYLPLELGNLKRCWNMQLHGLNITNLPDTLQPGTEGVRVSDICAHLKAQLRKSEPCNRMKLMVVGLQGQGKTTLLAALKGEPPPRDEEITGVHIDEWLLSDPSKGGSLGFLRVKNVGPDVYFSTYDLAGQPEYYVIHQCFLTPNTLYMVVWDLTLGEEGIDQLEPWLSNIHARAPDSMVILVGTHLDALSLQKRKDLENINSKILKQYITKKSKGFPQIISVHYVSCTTMVNIDDLKKDIYQRAISVTISSGENIIGRKVPRSYILLQDEVVKEVKTLASKNPPDPPVLTQETFEALANRIPECDIDTAEDLQLAASFLNETGVILHFNDQMRGLNTLYFIDPSWLCKFLTRVIAVRAVHNYVDAGKISIQKMKWLFHDNEYPKHMLPQYLQLLERFEIALALSSKVLLIPSMLPKEKPGFSPEVLPSLKRYYRMSYIPSGFWSRLITRLIVNVERLVDGNTTVAASMPAELTGQAGTLGKLSRQNSWNESRKHRRGFQLLDKKMIYWREGIVVTHSKGHFIVESAIQTLPTAGHLNIGGHQGINITVASQWKDYTAMGFIVDQIDALITEWFPGLEDRDNEGKLITQRLIPCPICIDQLCQDNAEPSSLPYQNAEPNPYEFTIEKCAMVAVNSDEITCEQHPNTPIQLAMLVPDLLLCDLPKNLMMTRESLDFEATKDTCLGVGGAAKVFVGRYKEQDVAYKQLHATQGRTFSDIFYDEPPDSGSDSTSSSKSSHNSATSDTDIAAQSKIKEEIAGMAAIRAFKELRGEVSLLCKLNHPNIVRLIGINLRPMCFALELAPMGSLSKILDDEMTKQKRGLYYNIPGSFYGTLLDRVLTYKIALQVITAFVYLHSKNIIYCDMKSDNVLVWSIDIDAPVNVKVSDYGISRISSPQGIQGSDGTPGFQAPEVRPGMVYDEKIDIFSYAMLLYELITGMRPFQKLARTIDITKAVREGKRPTFKEYCINANFPALEKLMKECWNTNPILRPSAKTISRKMVSANFLCQQRILEMMKDVKYMMYSPPHIQGTSSHAVWFWCGENEDRRCTIVDTEHGIVRMAEKCHPGSIVNCAIKLDNATWVGCQSGEIQVFGARDVGMPQCLWAKITRIPIKDLATQTLQSGQTQRVYAAQEQGIVTVFSRRVEESVSMRVSWNAHDDQNDWVIAKILSIGQEEEACNCVQLVKNELWVGCGSIIKTVNTKLLLVEHKISHPALDRLEVIEQMDCGYDGVWCSNSSSSVLVLVDVKTHRVTEVFECGIVRVGKVIKKTLDEVSSAEAKRFSNPCSDAGSQTDEFERYSNLTSSFPQRGSQERTGRRNAMRSKSSVDIRQELAAGTVSVMAIKAIKDTLWIGRSIGDVVIVCVNPDSRHGYQYGQVLAVLSAESIKGYRAGSVHQIISTEIDRVVVSQEYQCLHGASTAAKDAFRITVWENWGTDELALLDSIHQKIEQKDE